MNKMVINHIEKLFVTNDAVTIVNELEVEHPAAKLLVLASKMQEAEVGDGTNFVIIFAGELLHAAEGLLRLVCCFIIFNYIDVPVKYILFYLKYKIFFQKCDK